MGRGRPSRATVYARLTTAISELEDRLGGLPTPAESEFIWSDIWHLEAHHSTALEGNTLALREVEALLDKGRAIGFIVPSVAGPARLVPLTALADNQFSVAALRQAAARGRLEAIQGADGIWRSTRRAVEIYADTKGQKRKALDG